MNWLRQLIENIVPGVRGMPKFHVPLLNVASQGAHKLPRCSGGRALLQRPTSEGASSSERLNPAQHAHAIA